MKLFKSKDFYSVALAVVISLAVVAVSASAATTISTNIFTGGSLTVIGVSSTTGGFLSAASSTVSSSLNVAGYLGASSTSGFTGLSTFSNGFISEASSTLTTLSGTTTATFGVKVGSSGTAISQILFGTCSVDLPNIVATTTAVATCAATGVASSTRIFVTGYDLPDGIVFTGASSTAADTIQVSAFNLGHNTTSGLGAAINPPPTTWFWMGIQ
ncbi:MAG: hypothetical protein AAB952_00765 [Patescibacteria group bacterium]